MTCSEYDALLMKRLDGGISPEEEALLHGHEASCASCKARRLSLEAVQRELQTLDDAPPMPSGLHQGWMNRVEEAAMESKPIVNKLGKNKHPKGHKPLNRLLAAAAALVFVVGGTLMTKDVLNPKASDSAVYDEYAVADNDTLTYAAESAAPRALAYGGNAADTANASATTDAQKIIRTVSLTIGTQAYDDALTAITTLCADCGGWVERSSEYTATNGRRDVDMTLRIPADRLSDFLGSTDDIGRVIRREESTQDVTASYQDTQARLDTQKALMARLQSLVTTAADLSDVLALESQIADTQYTIDSLTASLAGTDRQVNYAAVTIAIQEETAAAAAQDTQTTLSERAGHALSAGWTALVGFLGDVAVFLMAALPFLGIVCIAIVIAVLIRRKIRKHEKE